MVSTLLPDRGFSQMPALNSTSPPADTYPDIIEVPAVRYVIIVVHLVPAILAIAGNSLVLLLVYRKKSLRKNPTILFILNLAVCDLISCLISRPLFLLDLLLPFDNHHEEEEYIVSLDYCKVTLFFQALISAVGFHTIVAISQERLLLICFPLHAKALCSTSRATKIVLIIWIVSVGLTLPMPLIYATSLTVKLTKTTATFCTILGMHYSQSFEIYMTSIFVIYFALPLLILSTSYAKIFHTLYKRSDYLDAHEQPTTRKGMRVRKRLAKMMLFVALVFALAWGPTFCAYLYIATGNDVKQNGIFLSTILEVLPSVSSSVNPFIYTLNSRTFRRGFKAVIMGRKPDENTSFVSKTSVQSTRHSFRRNSFTQNSVVFTRISANKGKKHSVIYYRPKSEITT